MEKTAHKAMIADFKEKLKVNQAIRNIEEQEEIMWRYKCYIAIACITLVSTTLELFWVN